MNLAKQALMECLSGLTTKKNEKEIWIEDSLTVEPIDDENYIVRCYWENGQLWWETWYKNDQRHGVHKGWDAVGKLLWEELCENGKRVKKIK